MGVRVVRLVHSEGMLGVVGRGRARLMVGRRRLRVMVRRLSTRSRFEQYWNSAGVAGAVEALRKPSLLLPHLSAPDVSALDFATLKRIGVRAVVFDKDNTLTAPYALNVHQRAAAGLERCLAGFGPENVAILSNSAGTHDDEGYREAEEIERALGISVVRHYSKKPSGAHELLTHWGGSVRAVEVLVVGDRLFTDVMFGTQHGMLTAHVTDILDYEGDNRLARQVRRVESSVIKPALLSLGVRAPVHPLLVDHGVTNAAGDWLASDSWGIVSNVNC